MNTPESERQVSREEAEAWCEENGLWHVETSVAEGYGSTVDRMIEHLIELWKYAEFTRWMKPFYERQTSMFQFRETDMTEEELGKSYANNFENILAFDEESSSETLKI